MRHPYLRFALKARILSAPTWCKALALMLLLSLFATAATAGSTNLFLSCNCSEQPAESQKDEEVFNELRGYLAQLAASQSFSGAVLVARHGKPVFREAYGMANRERNEPNKTTTKFNIGSMNKMFTAVAIAQLAERGKLSFGDRVATYLPDYPNKSNAERITIHQLLTHTSGMGDYLDKKSFAEQQSSFKTVSDYLPVIANDALAFEPGTNWQYSDAGYVLLGAIIERVSGESYYEYVSQHIFEPAGMDDTGFYPVTGELRDSATPYLTAAAGDSVPVRRPAIREELKGGPAGGGYSTVDDLMKFSIALCSNRLLSKRFTDIVTTGKVNAPLGKYAYGFGDVTMNGVRSFGHNGGGPGIAAQMDIFPELDLTVVVLSNYDGPGVIHVLSKIRTLFV